MKRFRYRLLLLLPLVIVIAIVVYLSRVLPSDDRPLLATDSSWNVRGNFRKVTPDQRNLFTDRVEPIYLIARRFEGDGSGQLVSRPFTAPKWISLAVIGDLTSPENQLYLRLVDRRERYPIRVRTADSTWRQVLRNLPSEWVGKQIQIVAEAGPREESNFFGLSSPNTLGSGDVFGAQVRSLWVIPAFAVALLLFLVPGFPLATRLAVRGLVEPFQVVPVAIVGSCLAGYLTFWVYFYKPEFGRCFGGAVLLGSVAVCLVDLWRGQAARRVLLSSEVWTPIGLMAAIGLLYLCLLFSIELLVPLRNESRFRFLEFILAIDNELPGFFADHLYNGQDPRQLIGEWRSSDRPPLQAGLALLQWPVGNRYGDPMAYSLVEGSALQCVWVPAVWALWSAAGVPRRRAGLALLFVTLSGFALVNTVFTWPKMLSAGLTLFAVTFAFFGRAAGDRLPLVKAILLGLTAGLAFLGHGGVAFTLLPFAVFLLIPRWYPGPSSLIVAACVFFAMFYPWRLYQAYYDPPGNLLIRQHLAGRSPTWDDGKPVWKNLLDAYSKLTTSQILQNKLTNLQVLFMASTHPAGDEYPWPPRGSPDRWPVNSIAFRRCDFVSLFWALGLLNLGWIPILSPAIRRSLGLNAVLHATIPRLALAAVLSWVVLMFGPGSTVIHQGSYATVLLLFASLASALAMLPGRLPYLLLVGQGTVFAVGWLLTSPANDYGVPDFLMIGLAVLLFVALVNLALGTAPARKVVTLKSGIAA